MTDRPTPPGSTEAEIAADSTDATIAPPVTPLRQKPGTRDVLKALGRRRVLLVLLIGLGSGLPFFLTGTTLGLWLREHGVTLAAIGFMSWVGLAYSFKFLWAPLMDKVRLPVLGGLLGQRRGWLVLTQLGVAASLTAMALIGPEGGLVPLGIAAVCVAFFSASQDIVADAWRIEISGDEDDLGLLAAAYALGYRIGLISAMSLILFVATGIGWNGAYLVFAGVMSLAVVATLMAPEPSAAQRGVGTAGAAPAIWTPRGLYDAIVNPFVAFVRTHRSAALLMLAAISLYRLPDFVMGPMTTPFFNDLGLTNPEIASVRLTVGAVATLLGIASAGLCFTRIGFGRTLLIGAILGPGSNLAYAGLAMAGLSVPGFALTLGIENFSEGFAGTALVAYMSSLVSLGYTATQYALLTSFYSILGKVLKGFSGVSVERLQAATDQFTGYALFFVGTAVVGIPALILCLFLNHRHQRQLREQAMTGAVPAPA